MSCGIDFCVLGPLVVRCDDHIIEFSGNRQQVLLSTLLLEANRIVTVDRLVDAMWGATPPVSALSQVRICVSQIRRKLAAHGGGDMIETHYGSYLIRVPPLAMDLYRFERHAELGRCAVRQGDWSTAAHHLRAALDEWSAPPPASFAGEWVRFLLIKLEEDRSAIAEEYIVTMLRLGRHREIVGELSRYANEFPYREAISAQLMLALYRSGRTADALDFFRRTRRRFLAELGIEPGAELGRMEQFILNDTVGAMPSALPPEPVPALADAEGRDGLADRLRTVERELAEMRSGLDRLLRATESRPSSH
jgi:DNA-binding SARP family transcriptional activator